MERCCGVREGKNRNQAAFLEKMNESGFFDGRGQPCPIRQCSATTDRQGNSAKRPSKTCCQRTAGNPLFQTRLFVTVGRSASRRREDKDGAELNHLPQLDRNSKLPSSISLMIRKEIPRLYRRGYQSFTYRALVTRTSGKAVAGSFSRSGKTGACPSSAIRVEMILGKRR